MKKNYYVGNMYKDSKREFSERRGWLVGEFMQGPRKTSKVEVKFWSFKVGEDLTHPRKSQKNSVDCAFILKGKIRGEVEDKEVVLKKGDYIIIQPRIRSNIIVEVLEDVEGLTIKAPSDHTDKVV